MSSRTFQLAPSGPAAVLVIGFVTLVQAVLGVLFVVMGLATSAMTFSADADGLHVDSLFYGQDVPRAKLDPSGASLVDLTTDPSRRPSIRTNGIGLPNYSVGWFTLVGGERALLFVTAPSKVVYVPTSLGYAVMMSAKDPEGLIAAIQGGPAASREAIPSGSSASAVPCVIGAVLLAFGAALLVFVLKLRSARFVLDQESLHIIAPFYGRVVPRRVLLASESKVLARDALGDCQPTRRTNGVGLPGLVAGWVHLARGDKALVFLGGSGPVAFIPTMEGYTLLLNTHNAQGLIDELRR